MPNSQSRTGTVGGRLRLLATTDIHMALLGHDYVTDRALATGGLARLAPLIATARAEAHDEGAACVLFDNGDLLQGTPLGDHLSATPTDPPNPVSACLNHLGYDAIGLGNHDFDHGLPYLAQMMQHLRMPAISTNLACRDLPRLQAGVIVTRDMARTTAPGAPPLRIGVLSVLPPQTTQWNRHHIGEKAATRPPIEALATAVPALRADGADLVMVLAHLGIGGPASGPGSENAAEAIAALDGVDAVIAGHTHRRFPGPDHLGVAGADPSNGTLNGTPAAMPGAFGRDLAVIDLDLVHEGGRWRARAHKTQLRPSPRDGPQDADLVGVLTPAHSATRQALAAPIGSLKATMHSYFARARPGPITALIAQAKMAVLRDAVAGGPDADLPVLASADAALSGGHAGPDHFIHLRGGAVAQRDIAGLCPYPNYVWAVRATGAQVINWLEHAARFFAHLRAGDPDQPLTDPTVPGFRFDTLYGLDYTIDPTRPHDRISGVSYQGRPVRPGQTFLVATTQFRAAGGGGYHVFDDDALMIRGQTTLRDALVAYLRTPDCAAVRGAPPWRFKPGLGVQAVLHTHPDAITHLADIADLAPTPLGKTEDGFLRLRLSL
ncbi:5'-nucleotidase C-terminal domain-containing protein [Sulfitobacter sabulilitoris]|uniref:Bifunctional metallophosphatase/5'-nucleotidase n=1 Tax=Sulfitobacter sabulilitoris TaxID=2562655 RepID=A0A5S3PFP7_9RHOB|nr:5'-nucleotidase C-terminal domain-containing protein [Sulfitobacter sabulilitoris]TMM52892.1 bifunctional metallophosphatase/5'-nucleotidase [Sulfitobacter sabulilitoris]